MIRAGLRYGAAAARRSLVSPSAAAVSTAMRLSPCHHSTCFSTNEATTKKELSYKERKKAAKEERRIRWHERQENYERRKTRRLGRANRGIKQAEFRRWFVRQKVNDEYMHRKARQAGMGWNFQVAAICERLNVVLPDKEQWEKDYDDLRAYLDIVTAIDWPGQFAELSPDPNVDHPFTEEDLLAQLPEGFKPAPRETEADHSGDVRTTNRRLKDRVYLTVQQEGDTTWQFPTVALGGVTEDGLDYEESLLEAAKRAMAEHIGPSVVYWTPSNAPWAVKVEPLPTQQERDDAGIYGTKTFFVKIQYDVGQVNESEMTVQDYAWLDRGEVVERVLEQQGEHASKLYHYML